MAALRAATAKNGKRGTSSLIGMEAAALKREKENLFSHASTVYYYCKLSAALHTRLYGSSIETQVES